MKTTLCVALLYACTAIAQPASQYDSFDKCFILYDMQKSKIVNSYDQNRCAKRIPPDSSFKVPLSIMAFDNKTITQQTIFKWNINKWDPINLPKNDPLTLMYLSHWTENQTPKTWLAYSVVWVSQEITPQLGLAKIQYYLKMFNYGNQDFSGDEGKNNGLSHAWISSSLKISAVEQLTFLQHMFTYQLSVDKAAISNTIANLPFKQQQHGWRIYGKTGSGYSGKLRDGWFIGYAIKDNKKYLFVSNLSDKTAVNMQTMIGVTAKDYTISQLHNMLK